MTPEIVARWTAALNALLPKPLCCPLCRRPLRYEPLWCAPRWLCAGGHGYSNAAALLSDLRAQGWQSPPRLPVAWLVPTVDELEECEAT